MKKDSTVKKSVKKIKTRDKNKKEIEKYQKQAEELLAGWKRAQADYQNLKKESELERGKLAEYIRVDVLHNFFPLIDNFNIALEHVPAEQRSASWFEGFNHLKNQLDKIFADLGIVRIETCNKEFDVICMEAVETEGREDVKSGKVIKEIGAGFKFNNKVIKPAKVIVAK